MGNEKLLALLNTLGIKPSELKREENFGLRMRLQKVAYLLQYIGEQGFDYSFSTYFRGPYSVDLAKTSSLLTETPSGKLERSEEALWFFARELEWLNIATTIMMLEGDYRGRDGDLFRAVKQYRERTTEEQFGDVLRVLRKRGVLRP